MKIFVREILIIDDDPQSILILSKILKAAHYRVCQAATIEEAIRQFKVRAPHLILLDLVLHKETGFDFLKLLSQMKQNHRPPIIVITALQHRDILARSLALGACDILIKPLVASTLLQKVNKALSPLDILTACLPKSPETKVQIQAHSIIHRASETGFLLDVPFRITEDSHLKINAPFLKDLACETCLFKRTKRPSLIKSVGSGRFLNEVDVIGISAVTLQRLRDLSRTKK